MKTPIPWRGAGAATLHYTAAFLLTTLVHELGHALTSKLLGGQPVLYNTHVENLNEHLPMGREVAIALAGPLLSLVQGLGFLAWAWRQRGAGDAALWRLYLGVFGIVNFLSYLLISLLYPILSSMVLGPAWGRAMRSPYPGDALAPDVPLLRQLHLGWAVAALAVVGTVSRLLAAGVAL